MSSQERREMFSRFVKEQLSKMTPNCGRFSGQQVAYAKGRAWKRMQEMGL